MNQARQAMVRDFARDWTILLSVIFVYFLLRAAAPGDEGLAVRVTLGLIRVEKWLHIFWEPEVQSFTLRWDWLKEAANYVYSYFHFPALAVMGVLLWFRDRAQFRLVRNTMFVSMVIGLVFYYALPAAPPRLMAMHGHDYGFADTVFGGGTTVEYPTTPFFVNDYAAIPSFHFGWIALASWGLWTAGSNVVVRMLALVLTVVMTWACAATANHFFIDMALGGVVIVAAWAIAKHWLPPAVRRWKRQGPVDDSGLGNHRRGERRRWTLPRGSGFRHD